ncbi:hypothetical protein [Serratia marcescens]|uniref:hypothetical protein n=1 Tax=Serratia marcescens TaxID=615 RepID=UPI001F150A45|nr:hypothetical protein [Serratia marcescens]MDP8728354.1 hypothetical protein [Serratia marcescens]
MKEIKIVYIGEDLNVKTESTADVAIGRDNQVLLEAKADKNGNAVLTIDSLFEPGHYSLVTKQSNKILSTEVICIKSPFVATSKKEQLRGMIKDIDKVIQYRLTNDDDAIQSMAINGKNFVYEPLNVLMDARKKLVDQLSDVIQSENLKNGKSPIITIKARFVNPR